MSRPRDPIPYDLLPAIFSYVGATIDLSAIARTCRRWHRVAANVFRSRDVILDCFGRETKYFDFRSQEWTKVEVNEEFRTEKPLALLLADGVITVVDTFALTIKQFDPAASSWRRISPLSRGLEHPPDIAQFACCYHSRCIYLAGGYHMSDDTPSSNVYAYHMDEKRWCQMRPLPVPCVSSACAVLKDSSGAPALTVIGGTIHHHPQGASTVGFYLQLASATHDVDWRAVSAPPTSILRLSSRCVIISESEYLVGSWLNPSNPKFTLIAYNLSQDAWKGPYPIPPSSYIFPALLNGQIAGMALDDNNRLLTLAYDNGTWHTTVHPREMSTQFSLILGVPYSSIHV